MLYNLFNSRFGRCMSRFGDLLLLQVIFLLTSIPVFTAGAGIAALYSVSKKMHNDSFAMVIPAYFSAFKANFKKATLLWLCFLASGALLFFDLRFCRASDAPWLLFHNYSKHFGIPPQEERFFDAFRHFTVLLL